MKIDEFISSNSDLASTSGMPSEQESSISVIVLGINDSQIQFGYSGSLFTAPRSDVLDISEQSGSNVENPFGRGKPAKIKLSQTARVREYIGATPESHSATQTTHETVTVSGGITDDCGVDQGF